MLAWKKNQNNQFSTLPGLKKVIIIIKKKSNQPYMLKCGHVKKRRRVYALEKNGH
jgi:hypothetical protein